MTTSTKIRDLAVPKAQLQLSFGPTIELRGINASDLILLTNMFGPQLAMAYAKVKNTTKEHQIDYHSLLQLVQAITKEAPSLLGWVIAISNDDPAEEAVENVMGMPLVDQASMLEKIASLTMENEATVKKLVESLSGIYQTISGAVMAEVKSRNLPTGIGPSADS